MKGTGAETFVLIIPYLHFQSYTPEVGISFVCIRDISF